MHSNYLFHTKLMKCFLCKHSTSIMMKIWKEMHGMEAWENEWLVRLKKIIWKLLEEGDVYKIRLTNHNQGQNCGVWISEMRRFWGLFFWVWCNWFGLLYSWRQEQFRSQEDSYAWLQVGDKDDGDWLPYF